MATAKFVNIIPSSRGIQILYKMDPPLPNYAGKLSQPYVILYSVKNDFAIECYIYASNEDGNIVDFEEMLGSTPHTTNHAEVLAALGYTIEV